jgi:outer membrane protein OmpA-like peptidoglycan-associated protein/Tol biopolymer transport system component
MLKPFYPFILFFTNSFLFAQSVYWAESLVAYSSFSTSGNLKQFGPDQVLGTPSKLPGTGSSGAAWAPAREDGGEEFIQVRFKDHIHVQQIAVGENFNPGSIVAIVLVDEANISYQVYTNPKPGPIKGITGRMFNLIIPKTEYKVAGLKLYLNTAAVKGSNQIDAIAVSDSKDTIKAMINTIDNPHVDFEKENLGTNVNSPTDELAPFISPDGNTLYFTRRLHPGNIGDSSKQDLWFARSDGKGGFLLAENIGAPINNAKHNSASGITPDGQRMLILNTYYADGSMGKGLSMAHANGDKWEVPETIHIENFYNENQYGEYCLSVSGKYLIMAVERDDSEGGKDLYISFETENELWTEPKKMGSVINTVENETSPFIAADERTLYFSSKGHPGYGSNDVFVTYRLDDTWTNWSPPLNLGNSINTAGWDSYFTIPANGEYAYFVSNTNSIGEEDIFRQKLPESAKPKPVVLVSGRVLHNDTRQPLKAKITYENLSTGMVIGEAYSDSLTGEFKIILPAGNQYGIVADKFGFFSVSENLNLIDIKAYQENKKDILMVPIEVGSITRLNNIFFDFDKATLKTESYTELNRLIKLLNDYPGLVIEIAGHTDYQGAEMYNLNLSQDRAETVTTYLTSNGIAQNRVVPKGYGETKLLSTAETEEAHQLNRRVEFKILKK